MYARGAFLDSYTRHRLLGTTLELISANASEDAPFAYSGVSCNASFVFNRQIKCPRAIPYRSCPLNIQIF